ncbi:MAG: hypothetical protein B7Z71_00460 [Acidocella sp. 21-58-7]|nr:MAG: hypothetical protein B7Z71_00460 [Acidocella sp. 21-58-7]HQT65836.1 hypothetical protein [Acidocella sp.]
MSEVLMDSSAANQPRSSSKTASIAIMFGLVFWAAARLFTHGGLSSFLAYSKVFLILSPGITAVVTAILLRKPSSSKDDYFRPIRLFFEAIAKFNPLMKNWSPEKIQERLNKLFDDSPLPILRGDRETAARSWYDPERFPWLYVAIPADIRRPVTWTGKLPGDRPVTELVWRHLTPAIVGEFVVSAGRGSVRPAAVIALTAAASSLALIFESGWHLFTVSAPYQGVPWWAGTSGVSQYLWIFLSNALENIISLGFSLFVNFLLVPAVVFAITQRLAAKLYLGRLLSDWLSVQVAALASPSRDSLVLHPTRAADRVLEQAIYARQVSDATTRLAHDPVIPIGRATGTFRARGDDEAPVAGQMVAVDYESLRQNMVVLGATGTGKTRLVLKPLARSVLKLNSAARRIGMMVLDGKGVLHLDLAELPEIRNREDVVVIGTGPGQVGVDLVGGLSPLDVAAIAETVSAQLLPDEGGGFWSSSASLLVLHAAALARAMSFEPTLTHYLDSPAWSLAGIYQLAKLPPMPPADNETRNILAIVSRFKDMSAAYRDGTAPAEIAHLRDLILASETQAAITWFVESWAPMAEQTRSGISAHLDSVFGKFAGSGRLSQLFGCGDTAGAVSVDHALRGGILLVAVGTAEWGAAGHLVAVWLKTLLFMRARQLLQRERAARRDILCVMLADEYQMLATASGNSAGRDDDSNIWNISREAGLSAVFACQSFVALKQSIGETAARNLMQQARSKIFLSTDEIETIKFAKEISGQVLRGPIYQSDDVSFHESIATREIASPDRPINVNGWGVSSVFGGFGRFKFETPPAASVARPDRRFIVAPGRANMDIVAHLSSLQASAWRASDQARSALMSVSAVDKLETADLMLGHGLAFAQIMRAGVDRSDIIDLSASGEEHVI